MQFHKYRLRDGLFMLAVLAAAFSVNLLLLDWFDTQTMIPMIFVLGVFLVSWRTQGYFWGIAASLISVLLVNYAFTYPYWAFDLISPECISSAVVMLIVAIMTGALTTQIKEQEKMKAEAEKERMRGNLLRAVSHDLRTPLTSIYGACSAMIENYDDLTRERHLKLLGDMQGDAQWLVRMVENLLSVTRIDGNKVRLTKKDTVLEELVDAVLVKFHKHYPSQQVQVEIPEEFVSLPMDAMLIEQVLMNLLENAVFHAHGMKNLWLTAETRGNKVYFTVADDGCGIPPERMEGLFSGLLDSEAPTDTSRSSMGIGLSVCCTIIKAHGGEIRAKNRQGGGAEFRFALEMEEKSHGE
ncbi:MAG: DUF4118 domain-containing protein [Oscillospiraceae bacterium]|nr:DUF4118 domain-containing protein [Oscillospiraceae bacterium]